MEKRIKKYLLFLENLKPEDMEEKELESVKSEIERQIGFFQHERLIHLIVTVTFALLTVISLFASLFSQELMCAALTLLLFILLIPYIRHYFILENSVQKMYGYYDLAVRTLYSKYGVDIKYCFGEKQ